MPLLSVIIPVYNESGNFAKLHGELQIVLPSIDPDWEKIFADEGSTGNSCKLIEELHR